MKHQKSYELINNLSFCVFDLETTGGNHQNDKIIEIGLVKIENFKVTKELGYLIKPEVHIPEFIQKLTNIKDADVNDAPLIEDVIDEILEFMGDSILVAHNTSFDVPFFNSVLKRLGKEEISNKALCTNLMTKYMIPNLLSSNLNYMSKIFGLEHQKAHRALDDAKASAELLLTYLSIFVDKDIQKVNSLYYPKNKFELDRINYKKGVDLKEIEEKINSISQPFMIIFKGQEGVVLYALPLLANPEDKKMAIKKLKEIPFETFTLKLIGPFINGLIELSSFYAKMPETHQKEIISYICKSNNLDEKTISTKEEIPAPADFVVFNHIIPEQYIIYPIDSYHQKMELVFRYPSHQNKLIQYINSKSARMAQSKLKKDNLNPLIRNLIHTFMKASSEVYLIHRSNQKLITQDIKVPIEEFIEKNPNNYQFPQKFL